MTKISLLPERNPAELSDEDALPIIGGGATYQVTIGQLVAPISTRAEAASSVAESLVRPAYADTAAGLADTVDGEFFAVADGDATVTIYQNQTDVAVWQRKLATTAALGGEGGHDLVAGKQSLVGAVLRSIGDVFSDQVSVMDFIPFLERVRIRLRTSTADLAGYLLQASAEVGENGSCFWPRGLYHSSVAVPIRSGQNWRGDRPTVRALTDTQALFRADQVDGWSLDNFDLEGTLVEASDTDQFGLHITSCSRHRVRAVQGVKFKGAAFLLDGDAAGDYRGDRGQFTDCSGHENSTAIIIQPGAGAEYNTFVNFLGSGNIIGAVIGAGNNTFLGGALVDNYVGISLIAGPNHGHGKCVGTDISHNATFNIEAHGITLGFDFEACHIYDGDIWFDGCNGCVVRGGKIDVGNLYNYPGPGSGYNWIVDADWRPDYGPVVLNNTGANDRKLIIMRCFGPGTIGSTGLSINDPSPVHVAARREAGEMPAAGQPISSTATRLVFPTIDPDGDKRGALDIASGILAVPPGMDGRYLIEGHLVFSGTALDEAASYVELGLTGTVFPMLYMPQKAFGTSILVIPVRASIYLNAGDNVSLKATIAGNDVVFGSAIYNSTLEFRKL